MLPLISFIVAAVGTMQEPTRLGLGRGSVLSYGFRLPTTLTKNGKKFPLDLEEYFDRRLELGPHEVTNQLSYLRGRGLVPYLLQVVKVGANQGLGVVGYTLTSASQPSDQAHDLVLIQPGRRPLISFVRGLEVTRDKEHSPTQLRLFQSRAEWWLRTNQGFEVLNPDWSTGKKIAVENSGRMVGLNSTGELIFGQRGRTVGIAIYNLAKRAERSYVLKPPLNPVIDAFYDMMKSTEVAITVSGNVQGGSEVLSYWIDSRSGKILRGPERRDN